MIVHTTYIICGDRSQSHAETFLETIGEVTKVVVPHRYVTKRRQKKGGDMLSN